MSVCAINNALLVCIQTKAACDALCKYLEQAEKIDSETHAHDTQDGKESKEIKQTESKDKQTEVERAKSRVGQVADHFLTVLRVNKGVFLCLLCSLFPC